MQDPGRLFTVAEVNALLPQLRGILETLRAARENLRRVQEELAAHAGGGAKSNGHVAPDNAVARLTQAAEAEQARILAAAQAIAALGGELKDPDRGMVDFRTLREGRVVYLCWLMDEPAVQFWHELEGGYAGRQPLD